MFERGHRHRRRTRRLGDRRATARARRRRGRRDAELRLLCVPDRAIAEVARSIEPGPWVAHVSGATPLAALDPHERRFSVHPLQTLTRARGPEQLDGAWAAVTARDRRGARARALWLAETLGLRPFALADDRRALYHAGAAIASNFLVTLYRAASRLVRATAGAPPEALVPLMTRTIENGFELTGPIARGDWATVERAPRGDPRGAPSSSRSTTALAEATPRMIVVRTIARARRCPRARRRRPRADDGRAARRPRGALRARRAPSATSLVASLFVNPAQFSRRRRPRRVPARPRAPTRAFAEAHGVDVLFAPSADEMYPPGFATWVEPDGAARGPRGRAPARATSAASRPSA